MALNVKTHIVISPSFHTIETFKQPQDKPMFQKTPNDCLARANNKHCPAH